MSDEDRAVALLSALEIYGHSSDPLLVATENVRIVADLIREVRAEAHEAAAAKIDEVYETYPRVGYEEADIDRGRLNGFEVAANTLRDMAALERTGKAPTND
jgi:hypothetical protein